MRFESRLRAEARRKEEVAEAARKEEEAMTRKLQAKIEQVRRRHDADTIARPTAAIGMLSKQRLQGGTEAEDRRWDSKDALAEERAADLESRLADALPPYADTQATPAPPFCHEPQRGSSGWSRE